MFTSKFLYSKLQATQFYPLNIEIEADHFMVYPPKGTKAIELILDYPSIDMNVKLPQSEIFSDKGMTLSMADTIGGQLLINSAYFEKSDRPVRIDLQHLQRDRNIPVDILSTLNTFFSSNVFSPDGTGIYFATFILMF